MIYLPLEVGDTVTLYWTGSALRIGIRNVSIKGIFHHQQVRQPFSRNKRYNTAQPVINDQSARETLSLDGKPLPITHQPPAFSRYH